MKIRYPGWAKEGELAINVNGNKTKYNKTPNGYAEVSRKWKKGDEVEIVLPIEVGVEQLHDESSNFAFTYGPIVLAAKTGTENLAGLYADASRMGHIAHGHMEPLKNRQVIVTKKDELSKEVRRTNENTLEFELNSVFTQGNKTSLKLMPFYRIHDSRYNIYWLQATEEELQTMLDELEQAEAAEIALDNITIDKINCGEQQPEADHFIEFEKLLDRLSQRPAFS